jgi:hypothetical protein
MLVAFVHTAAGEKSGEEKDEVRKDTPQRTAALHRVVSATAPHARRRRRHSVRAGRVCVSVRRNGCDPVPRQAKGEWSSVRAFEHAAPCRTRRTASTRAWPLEL